MCVLDCESSGGQALLDAWPCSEIWGVASATAAKLAVLGIHTAGELSRALLQILRKLLGVVGERIALELRGISCLEMEEVREERQGSLFRPADPEAEEKQRRLMAAVDQLNLWGGRGTVRPATIGFAQKWQMRQDRKSPSYTTRLSDVPVVSL